MCKFSDAKTKNQKNFYKIVLIIELLRSVLKMKIPKGRRNEGKSIIRAESSPKNICSDTQSFNSTYGMLNFYTDTRN